MDAPNKSESINATCLRSVNDEHRLLAEKISAVSREIDASFTESSKKTLSDIEKITRLLEELREIAQAHFEHEEALMAENNFPGAAHHKRDHDYLLKSLIHFTSSLNHGSVPFSPDVGVNLRSWLTYHIKKYDDVYVAFIEDRA